jgi:hypothetical protein
MTNVAVDSDVVSYVFKNHPFGSRYDTELAGHITLFSFMTVAGIDRNDYLGVAGLTLVSHNP